MYSGSLSITETLQIRRTTKMETKMKDLYDTQRDFVETDFDNSSN